MENKSILISRTDSIGDVILTLPLCAWLKQQFPAYKIYFLGRNYTKPILKCFPSIDEIVIWDEIIERSEEEQVKFIQSLQIDICIHVFPRKEIASLMKKAGIETRVGTSHRLFHRFTCTIRPNFTRKNSDFHEAQLNFELVKFLGLKELPSLEEISELVKDFQPKAELSPFLKERLANSRKKIILHPKSQGSAVEWEILKYYHLAEYLVQNNWVVYFSGTEEEGKFFRERLPQHPHIIDISGKSSLAEFITFISKCDALVACSTGPLHIASILGIQAIGLYTDLRPIHPGRWKPIGKNISVITRQLGDKPKETDIHSIGISDVIQVLESKI